MDASSSLESREPVGRSRSGAWALIVPVALVLATLATYLPALSGEFLLWDDYLNLVNNPHFRGLGWANVRWMFTTFHNDIYEPLSWLAKAVQYQLWGMREAGYHACTLVLHTINVLCVYFITARLLSKAPSLALGARRTPQGRDPSLALGARRTPQGWDPSLAPGARTDAQAEAHGERRGAGVIPASAIAALLFGLHPLRTECVALISAQPHVQAATLALLAVWAYLAKTGRRQAGPLRGFPLLALVLYAISLLSKATAIGLPAALLVLDVCPLGRWKRGRRRGLLLEKVPFVILALLAAWVARAARSGQISEVALESFGLADRIAQASFCVVFHVYKTVFPKDLMPIYAMLDDFDPWSSLFLVCMGLVVAVSACCTALRKRAPALAAAWVWYLVMLSPFMGLTNRPHFPVDRYTYLPMLAFSTLAGAGLVAAWRARSTGRASGTLGVPIMIFALVIAAALGVLARRQTRIFNNSVALFEHILPRIGDSPRRADMLAQLGVALYHTDRLGESVRRLHQALALNPQNTEVHLTLGLVLGRQGKWDEAVAANQRAYELNPDDHMVNFNLATALVSVGRPERAIEHFRRAIEPAPDEYDAYLSLGNVLARLGRHSEAMNVFQEGINRTGGAPMLMSRAAWLLATCPEPGLRDGAEALRLAVAVNDRTGGSDPRALDVLAAAYAELGRVEAATQVAARAVQRAEGLGEPELAEQIRLRLAVYESGKPYREGVPHPEDPLPSRE